MWSTAPPGPPAGRSTLLYREGNVTLASNNYVYGAAPLTIRGGTVTITPTSTNVSIGGTVVVDDGAVLNVNGVMNSTASIRVGQTAGSRSVVTVTSNLTVNNSLVGGNGIGLQIGAVAGAAVHVAAGGGSVAAVSSVASGGGFAGEGGGGDFATAGDGPGAGVGGGGRDAGGGGGGALAGGGAADAAD